jgi:chromosome segregation ATPase
MNDSFLPNEDMDKMRREIDFLKKKQGIVDEPPQNNEIRDSMAQLSRSLSSLTRIFKEASEEMKMDTHDAVLVSQKIEKIIERLEKIEAQNEKIAKGIVAVADMIEEIHTDRLPKQTFQSRMPSPIPQQMSQSSFEPKPLPTYNMPPEDEKKKTFLNFKI